MSDLAVDRYKIRAPLRCDGVGSLDCAEDESGMRMAIRWLPLDANGDAAVKTVEKLPAHPMLPKIRGTGHVGTAAYVAMEFPEGKLLSTSLGLPIDGEAVRRLGADMLDALATVHADGAFHGELSSDSILMLPDGRAILWDMPLVIANRLTDRRGEERFMRQLIHLAAFLSPERARGNAATAASDLYSLGAVLCAAAGAEVPTEGSTLSIIHRIATGQWAPQVPASLPEETRGLLKRMLAAEPSTRPSAKEAAALLRPPKPAPPPERHAAITEPEMRAVKVPAAVKVSEAKIAELEAPEPKAPPPVVKPPEPVVPEVKVQASAVVAPSIEVATNQIAVNDVRHFVLEPQTDPGVKDATEDDEEFDVHRLGWRTPKMVWAIASGLGALLASGGAVVAWNFPRAAPEPPVAQGRAAPEPPRELRPTLEAQTAIREQVADGSLLQPLVHSDEKASGATGKHVQVIKPRAPAPRPAAPARKAPASAPAAASAPAPVEAKDFNFLSSDAQAPQDPLKRP